MLSLWGFFAASLAAAQTALAAMPEGKVYGVNLGSWLLIEPWLLPEEWVAMGGERCDSDCSACIANEFNFAKAYPDTAEERMSKHWESWFTQDHVAQFVDLGLNTVRIPLGYWIVEDLVDRSTEYYTRGGIKYLVKGLAWLRDAGIHVILDHHALPGVSSPNQMFAGRCTSDVEFYTPYNYGRALTWAAVMTALTHLHPNFESVFSIQAVNEPIQDASKTPGYGDYQIAFVETVRLVEVILGVFSPAECEDAGYDASGLLTILSDLEGSTFADASLNVTLSLRDMAERDDDWNGGLAKRVEEAKRDNVGRFFSAAASKAVGDALPMILDILQEVGFGDIKPWGSFKLSGDPIVTNFMDVTWQYGNRSNPADAALGPQSYDDHSYYAYGGVADANAESYMSTICNQHRAAAGAELGNSPLWTGEWSLATNFNATQQFMSDWADAQKMSFSEGAGWIFWNFWEEESATTGDQPNSWSYLKAVELGYLTKDPSQYNNPSVCDPYRNVTATA